MRTATGLGADLDGRDARDLHRLGPGRRAALAGRAAGRGWVTAEYGMLPASTGERKQRDVTRGRPDGRTVEIQRLIGRSLRGVVDFEALGERTIYLDCDVLQADGGTRCAVDHRRVRGARARVRAAAGRAARVERSPLTGSVAAVSCGVVDGVPLLDLDYAEDSTAEVDANVVMTGDGGLVEVQATAERTPLSRAHLDDLLALAEQRHRRSCARCAGRAAVGAAMRLVLATRNAHKVREFARPARRRSRSRRCPTTSSCRPRRGRRSPRTRWSRRAPPRPRPAAPAIADDSGIESAALGGAPGRALGALRRRGRDRRGEPRQAAARGAGGQRAGLRLRDRLRRPGGEERVFEGRCTGTLAAEPRGDGGFGYDPAFVPDDVADGRTMAELAADEKDAISHRGRAARALLRWLAEDRERGAGRSGSLAQVDRRACAHGPEHRGVALVARDQQGDAGHDAGRRR